MLTLPGRRRAGARCCGAFSLRGDLAALCAEKTPHSEKSPRQSRKASPQDLTRSGVVEDSYFTESAGGVEEAVDADAYGRGYVRVAARPVA